LMTTVPCKSFPATIELSAKEIETSFCALKQITRAHEGRFKSI
jgi:hypothetical protein